MKKSLHWLFYGLIIVFISYSGQLLANPGDTTLGYKQYFGQYSPKTLDNPQHLTIYDEDIAAGLPIGFTFNFFGKQYTEFNIIDNGYISFDIDDTNTGCCSGQVLPNPNSPNNLIAFAWDDLDPGNGGTIQYQLFGETPSRILVVEFNNVPFYNTTGSLTSQIHLYESSNRIEIHSGNVPDNGESHTMGIENADGTMAYVVNGRNSSQWSATNEMVAFEPYFPSNDAALTHIEVPEVVCEGSQDIYVVIENLGINPLQSVSIGWEINGQQQSPISWTGQLDSLTGTGTRTDKILLGSRNFSLGDVLIKAWTYSPNNQEDVNTYNDTTLYQFQVKASMNGAYTIGGTSPDFTTFGTAVASLSQNGICGPVVFNVRNGSYTEQISIPQILGASSVNTITFQSENNDKSLVTLGFAASADTANYTLRLNGADYVTFKGITLKANSLTHGRVVELTNSSQYNSFLDNSLIAPSASTTDIRHAVVYSGGSLPNHKNTFKNNYLVGGSYGLYIYGNYDNILSKVEEGGHFEGNTLENQYTYSLYLYSQGNSAVRKNYFKSNSNNYGYHAIYAEYQNEAFTITDNKIVCNGGSGIFLRSPNSTLSSSTLISNNAISVLGTAGLGVGNGILVSNGSHVKLYNNSVLLLGNNTESAALFIENSNNQFVNNNLLVNKGLGRALKLNNNSNYQTNYNNLYTTGSTLVSTLDNTFSSLLVWRRSGNQDANSISIDPQFNSSLDLRVNSLVLNGAGTPLTEITTDIEGVQRQSPPDMGAYEFSPSGSNLSVVAVHVPQAPFSAGTYPVYAILRNSGAETISDIQLAWEVNGESRSAYIGSMSLQVGETDSVSLGSVAFDAGVSYSIKVWSTIADLDETDNSAQVDNIYAALSGDYSIGSNADFATFSEAVAALNIAGVSGPVNFLVQSGAYSEQVVINEVSGASADSPITFRSLTNDKAAVTLSYNSTLSDKNYTLLLEGADYIAFENITIKAASSSYGHAVYLRRGVTHSSFTNCQIEGLSTTSASDNLALLYTAGGSQQGNANEYNTFANNTFVGGSVGLNLLGYSNYGYYMDRGNLVENNIFQSQYYRAMFLRYQEEITVSRNKIFSNSNVSDYTGIYSYFSKNGIQIIENEINAATGYGINIYYNQNDLNNPSTLANNFISIGSNSYAYGIYVYNSTYQNIYHNSVRINSTSTNANYTAALYYQYGNYNSIYNNLFVNAGTGYALIEYNSNAIIQSDYNNYFTAGNKLVNYNNTLGGLELLRTIGREEHAISVTPRFVSSSDLHIISSVDLKGKGLTLSEITTDIDGETRQSPPDLGADEFPLASVEAGLVGFFSPGSPALLGEQDVTVSIVNGGTEALQSLTLGWQVNNISKPSFQWNGNLASLDTTHIKIGTQLFLADSTYNLSAWLSNPNGQQDAYLLNDTTRLNNISVGIGKTYIIGANNADFATFNEAITFISTKTIADTILFKVQSGTYNEQLRIAEIPTLAAKRPIIFESLSGNPEDVVLTYGANSYANYTILLDGADHIIFRNISIKSANNSYGRVVLFQNGANYNQFINTRISGAAVNSTSTNVAVIYSTSGNVPDHGNIFRGNIISGGSYGMYWYGYGNNDDQREAGTKIINNVFKNQYYNGIRLYNQEAPVVIGNTVETASTRTDYMAVYSQYCHNGLKYQKNRISTNGGYGFYQNYCYATEYDRASIANNMISIGGSSTAYGFYFYRSTNQDIYHNSVNIYSSDVNAGRGLYYTYYYSSANIRNNIFNNSGGGYTLYFDNANGITALDNNNLYSTGKNLVYFTGDNYPDLASWQAGSDFDQNSISINPLFVSTTDLHANKALLVANGANVGITDDFDGDIRPETPAIGADEFVASGTNAALTKLIMPEAPFTAGSYPIQAQITNSGAEILTSLTIQLEVNGQVNSTVNWTGSLATGNSETITLENFAFSDDQIYSFKSWVALPNGGADIDASDDTLAIKAVHTALSGQYIVGAGAGADFTNLSKAVEALNVGGITSAVVFAIQEGTYNEQLAFNKIQGVNSTNTITLQPIADSASVMISYTVTTAENYVVKLSGTDYVTFNNIQFKVNNSNYGKVIVLENGADYNQFKNCKITGSTSGSYSDQNRALVYSFRPDDATLNSHHNTFTGNEFNFGSYGIFIVGYNGSENNRRLGYSVKDNKFTSQSYTGIFLENMETPIVTGNSVTGITNQYNYEGIGLYSCYKGAVVTNNKIVAISGSGIYTSEVYGEAGQEALIANNFITVGGSNTAYGIESYYSSYVNYVFNSINITSTVTTSGAAFYLRSSGNHVKVINNNFVNFGGGMAYYTDQPGSITVSNHNNIYSTGAVLGYWNSNFDNLAQFQALSGKEANSISVDPLYTSSTDLHVSKALLDGAGLTIANITTDIDGDTRQSPPDIGADEFDATGTNVTLLALNYPKAPFNPGSYQVEAVIQNSGASNLDSLKLDWKINGLSLQPISWQGNLATGQTDTVQLGTFNFQIATNHQLEVWISEPNGGTDLDTQDDTLRINNIYPALAGVYTIGGEQPNFASVPDAFNALRWGGIAAEVVFNIRSGAYYNQGSLSAVQGSSLQNKVIFQSETGNATDVIITHNSTSANNYTIQLDGASFITFQNLTLKAENNNYARVLSFRGGASHNIIQHCVLQGIGNNYDNHALVYSWQGSSIEENNNYNTIQDNILEGGSYGMLLYGYSSSSSQAEKFWTIKNNTFRNQYYHGMQLLYQENPLISGNTISTNSTRSDYTGIRLYYVYNNSRVEKNKIDISGGYGILTDRLYGSSENYGLIANNFITVAGSSNGYGLYLSSYTRYQNIFHNSVNITNTNSSGAAFYGNFYISSNINLVNNNLVNIGGGYALNINNYTTVLTQCDYNNYYSSGNNLAYWSGNHATLTSLQASSGKDVNSVSVDPNFVSDTDLHVAIVSLDNKGIPTGIITDDIDGQPRSADSPDIGADEFSTATEDVGLVALKSPKKPFAVGVQEVVVGLFNNAIDPLTSAKINWSVNDTTQIAYNWSGNLASGDTISLKIGSVNFLRDSAYSITAWSSLPNGLADQENDNDTIRITKLYAGLGGAYTIGSQSANYSTITAAVEALKNGGVVDSVIFTLQPGTYIEQISIPEIAGAGQNRPVTFKGTAGKPDEVVITNSATSAKNYTLQLDGADHIQIKDLTINAENTSFGRVLDIRNGATNNKIQGSILSGIATGSTSDNLTVIFSPSGSSNVENDNANVFAHNTIKNGSFGVLYYGYSTASVNRETGTVWKANNFEGQLYRGMRIDNQEAPLIENNKFITQSGRTDYIGLELNRCYNRTQVLANHFQLRHGQGIHQYDCDADSQTPGIMANNFISIGINSTAYGIYTRYSDNQQYVFNTINVLSTHATAGRAFYNYSGSGLQLLNNILVNSGAGYALYTDSPEAISSTDYNNLYVAGTNLTYWVGNRNSFAAHKTVTGKDVHSVSLNPQFNSDTDLHIKEVKLKSIGIPVAGITTDIDGEVRNSTKPDIGADEFVPPAANDAGLVAINSPAMPFLAGQQEVTVTLRNYGSQQLTTATLQWEINGTLQSGMNWQGSLAPGQEAAISLGEYSFGLNTEYDIKAWTSQPNGILDSLQYNDTTKVEKLYAALSGTYSIGAYAQDFSTIGEAAQAMEKGGVAGPVTFNIQKGNYPEFVIIRQITGASESNRIVFQSANGQPEDVVLTNKDRNQGSIIQLLGADYITIKNITVRANSDYNHPLVDIRSGANNNALEGNLIEGINTTSTSANYSLVNSPSNSLDSDNKFIGNEFRKGSYAFHYHGYNRDNLASGILIENNIFTDQYYRAIYLAYLNAPLVSGNKVSMSNSRQHVEGIVLAECDNNLEITKNYLVGLQGGYGIYLYYCESIFSQKGLIANNFIQVGGAGTAEGIRLYRSHHLSVLYNSVRITSTSASGRALYTEGSDNLNFYNNILANTGNGYAIYKENNASIAASNYNNLYATGANLGYWNGNRASFADWKGASAKDANSLSVDPFFFSITDLRVSQVELDSAALVVAEVNDDIEGESRSATHPDIGADEFSYRSNDVGIAALVAPESTCGLGAEETVTVQVVNYGGLPQSGFKVAYVYKGDSIVENISGQIMPGGKLNHTFSRKVDISALGQHKFLAYTILEGDERAENDSLLNYEITHYKLLDIPVANMVPADSSLDQTRTIAFSWSPVEFATEYDLYIWSADSANRPQQPTVAGIQQIRYTYKNTLTYGASYKWQIVAKNICSEIAGPAHRFTMRNLPDLVVEGIQLPATVFSGQTLSLDWQVKNIGTGNTGSAKWIDAIYLSDDDILDYGLDYYLGGASNFSALNPSQQYNQTASFTIPEGIEGNYYVFVVTDRYTAVGEAVENNNQKTIASTLQVNLTPPPDLQVLSILKPNTVFSGQPAEFSWEVRNTGPGGTRLGTWYDELYISPDSISEAGSIKLKSVKHSGVLLSDSGYTASVSVIIPREVFGKYYVRVLTDVKNEIYEHSFELNNELISDSMNIILLPPPDYVVTEVLAPEVASGGDKVQIEWTVANEGGTPPTATRWTDAIYISDTLDLSLKNARHLVSVNSSTKLAPGETYTVQKEINIPKNLAASKYYILVKTDINDDVYEYENNGNNVTAASSSIQLNMPDLVVQSINVPAEGASGKEVELHWSVRNNGLGYLSSTQWTDYIYGSKQSSFKADSATLLGKLTYTSALAAADSAELQHKVKLPNGISGTYYLYVSTDAENKVFEQPQENNNISRSNAIAVTLSPWADLQITQITVADTLGAGAFVNLNYEITNKGLAATEISKWVDKLYISKDSVWRSNATWLWDLPHDQILESGASYSSNTYLQLPAQLIAGSYYLHLLTDAENKVYEHTDEANNRKRSQLIYVKPYPPVDLAVTQAIVSGEMASGKKVKVSWKVENKQSGATIANKWADAVYLSNDNKWDSKDKFVAEFDVANRTLKKNESYAETKDVILPNGVAGSFYLLVVTDHKLRNPDVMPDNNYAVAVDTSSNNGGGDEGPIDIVLSPSSDLSIANLNVPIEAIAGQPVSLSWQVTNSGTGATVKISWTDKVYLSDNATLDANDTQIGAYVHNAGLGVGESYQASQEFTLPISASGNYYLVIKTDNNDVEYEHEKEGNNTRSAPISIKVPASSDIIVTDIVVPPTAIAGNTININWGIRNIGSNPATGKMKEAVFFSADSVWDINDVLLGTYVATINLAPQSTLARNVSVTLPGISLGSYHVLVQTDILNNIYEVSDDNNESFSGERIQIGVPELPLNIITAAELKNNSNIYYQVSVPDSLVGESLLVTLKGDSVGGSNELYLRHNQIPTRVKYDYSHDQAFKGNQEIIVPELNEGVYYLLTHGRSEQVQVQNIELFAKKLNFEIRSVNAAKAGNSGVATLLLRGSKFEADMQVSLYGKDTLRADSLWYTDPTKVYANFNLKGAPVGLYDVIAKNSKGEVAVLKRGFEVIKGGGSNLSTNIISPANTRPGRIVTMTIEFGNSGTNDIVNPSIVFESVGGAPVGLTLQEMENEQKIRLVIPLKEQNGPANVLRPGATGTITIYTQATDGLAFLIQTTN